MDIFKIDSELIDSLGTIYEITKDSFGKEPIEASAKMQKKIRKQIMKNYLFYELYPPEANQFVGKKVSDEDFFKFLKLCYEQSELNKARKKKLFNEASADLDEDAKNAIWKLVENDAYDITVRKSGGDVQISVDYGASFDCILTLINASGAPEGEDYYIFYFGNEPLIKQGDEYTLSGKAVNYEEEDETPFCIHFTDAKSDVTIFKATERFFEDTPWQHLQSIADEILLKYSSLGKNLNDREKKLLPLIAEINKLSYFTDIPDELNPCGFPLLKSYISKFGYDELFPLVERLEKNFSDDDKRYRISKKLISKLNIQKYEPLWRELYNLIKESQAEYPSKADASFPKDELNETRNNIQRLMEAHGYSGKYPDFVKKGSIKGISLANSYDMSYLISGEKNVRFHVHCAEWCESKQLTVQFICGTESLRKNETEGDIYSCMFNAKGRRLFKTVYYTTYDVNAYGECETDDLEQMVQIAVKKAELKNLTKEERKKNGDVFQWDFFFFLVIVAGGLFGLAMIASFMLFAIAVCLIDSQPNMIHSVLTETPWWAFLLFSWVAFGGIWGIVETLSRRK